MESVRIDRWLWAARFYKTRGLATESVLGGHVQLNGARVKPAKDVHVGDRVLIRIGALAWDIEVLALSEKRGPASVARTLYEESEESRQAREAFVAQKRLAQPLGADLGPRPTKPDRRRLDALRRAQRGR